MENDYQIEAMLLECPHTKKTFLGKKNYSNRTEVYKLEKRLYRLCDSNKLGRGMLIGKNRGEVVFYNMQKNYFIVVVETIFGIRHYYCKSIKDLDFGQQELCDCYIHNDFGWKYLGNRTILRNKILDYF